MPEDTGRHGTPRRPRPGHAAEFLLRGATTHPLDLLRRLRQREIADWPDVGPTQRHQQVEVRRPRSDARDLQELLVPGAVVKPLDIAERQAPIDNRAREAATVRRLLPCETVTPKPGLAETRDPAGRHSNGRGLQPRVRRATGRKRHLLLENDPDQRCKTGRSPPERRRTEAFDDARQVAVAGAELPDASE